MRWLRTRRSTKIRAPNRLGATLGAAGATWPPFFYAAESRGIAGRIGCPGEARGGPPEGRSRHERKDFTPFHGTASWGRKERPRGLTVVGFEPRPTWGAPILPLRSELAVEGAVCTRRSLGPSEEASDPQRDMTDGELELPGGPPRRRRLEKIQVLRTAESPVPPQEACSGPLGADLATDCPVGPPLWALRCRMADGSFLDVRDDGFRQPPA